MRGSRVYNSSSLALYAAGYGVLGFFMVQIGWIATFLTGRYAFEGSAAAVLFILPAAASFWLASRAIGGLASALRAR
jgi:hypothetical protein